ncbi:MAG: hypothetical protein M1821_007562 [Bathelium mastoideum]|nr:MAG: hypothetical protein M1821_007562 [Bathelium mastoideum]
MTLKGAKFLLSLLLLVQCSITSAGTTTLVRDICVIGGGSGGTYTAIRLQQEGKSVALIEKQNRLGGHVNTYIDPTTKQSFDYGVISFDNISVVTNYFSSLGIPLAEATYAVSNSINANFANGSAVSIPPVSPTDEGAALLQYQSLLNQYPYLTTGWQDLPSTLPADFTLSWGAYIQKYKLGALAYLAFSYLQGVGNILELPTIYVFKYLSSVTVEGILSGGSTFLTTAAHDNQALYNKALTTLGSNAFLSSNVTKVTRGNTSVQITVSTPSGKQVIQASKLVIAIPPLLSNLDPFLDVDLQEQSLFIQFNNSYYWDAVIENSGIPDNVTLNNVNPANPYDIPTLPGLYGTMSEPVPNVHATWYSSPSYKSDAAVQADILATIGRLNRELGYPPPNSSTKFVGFNNHAPFELTVSTAAIQNGFYQNLAKLQGLKNTYWTGATWQGAHDSSEIWNYTEHEVLPKILG